MTPIVEPAGTSSARVSPQRCQLQRAPGEGEELLGGLGQVEGAGEGFEVGVEALEGGRLSARRASAARLAARGSSPSNSPARPPVPPPGSTARPASRSTDVQAHRRLQTPWQAGGPVLR